MERWLVLMIIGAIVITGASSGGLGTAGGEAALDVKMQENLSGAWYDTAPPTPERTKSLRYGTVEVSECDRVSMPRGDTGSASLKKHAIDIAARIISRVAVEIDP